VGRLIQTTVSTNASKKISAVLKQVYPKYWKEIATLLGQGQQNSSLASYASLSR
jgi:cobalamin biosynthesis Co2+ chelatase CbiK